MLLEPLRHYLREVECAVRNLQGVYVERYQEEIFTPERLNLRIRIRFSQGFLLERRLRSIPTCRHCMMESNRLRRLGAAQQ